MVKRTIFIFVNGINSRPGSARNWTGRAVTYIQTKTPHKAEKLEYFCGIFSRVIFQKSNVYKLYKTMQFYTNWNIILVGHSNGCAVITDMIDKYNDWSNIKTIHLISAASEADFDKNHFNQYIREKRIGNINVYVGGKDLAIRFTKNIIGKLLGYKTLGVHGPYNVDDGIEGHVKTFWSHPWNEYGHSTAFSDVNFESTMKYITNEKKPSAKDVLKSIENQNNDNNIVPPPKK